MREFTKAAISYGWSTTVFQVQQLLNVLNGAAGESRTATEAFNAMAESTVRELGPTMRATYLAGDAMQRGAVNLVFGSLNIGGRGGCGPTRLDEGDAEDQPAGPRTARPFDYGRPPGRRPSWRDLRRAAVDPAPLGDEVDFPRGGEPQGWGPMP